MKANVVPAIVVRQPWASLLAAGIKDVENRRFSTRFRQLVICAGATNESTMALPTGAALALVDLVIEPTVSPWALKGWIHWRVTRVETFARPIPMRGMPGIFNTSAALADALRDATGQRDQLLADHDLCQQLSPLFGLPDWLVTLRQKPANLLLNYARPRWAQEAKSSRTETMPLV